MAYVPQNFYSGQKLTDEHLKHMEAGIQTADANAERALNAVHDLIAGGGVGLNKDQIMALDGLFKICTYTKDPRAAYNAFKTAFGLSGSGGGGGGTPDVPDVPDVPGGTTYTVTNNLTNVTNSNSATTVSGFYSATLSVEDGYSISVTITMGGVDITDEVYDDGHIFIPEVTGDIVITAQSRDAIKLYVLPEETVFDGTNYLDTGCSLFDEHKPFSILLEFSGSSGTVFSEVPANGKYEPWKTGFGMAIYSSWYWKIGALGTTMNYNIAGPVTNGKLVCTYDPDTRKFIAYMVSDGVLSTEELTLALPSLVGNTTGLRLGTGYDGQTGGFTGTIHKFEAYAKIVDAATINEFMGVA